MNQWTDSAKAKLEEYFARVRPTLAASGADVNEVTQDLRRHVEEEVEARQLVVVTEQDVGQILARIGAPEAPALAAGPQPSPQPGAYTASPFGSKFAASLLLFFGVLLPLGTIGFEYVTGMCAGVLFDPFPTLAHIALTVSVPVVNLLVWLALFLGDLRWRTWLGWANGFAIAVAAVYALLLLPFAPFALIGLIYFGAGLLPLAPLCSLICAMQLRWRLGFNQGEPTPLPGLWRGLGLGFGIVLILTLPLILTNIGLRLAASDSPEESARGVRMLRAWGQDEELLRACYGRAGRLGEFYASTAAPVDAETARLIYYRVNGKPFNSVPPPKLYAGRAQWNVVEREFTWDRDQAGDAVAGRVQGLSLIASRQDGVVEPDAALAYLEWSLEFKNVSPVAREARAQVLLPPGGVVSRLTLWINGEECEAAFGGRNQVKTAYKEVVTARRDPVIVTTCGPDRVLVQCFPVPRDGGTMKVRLGITAPLALTDLSTGYLRWPCFTERNFTIGEQLQHSLWVESSQPLETVTGKLKSGLGNPGTCVMRGTMRDSELSAPTNSVRVRRAAEVKQVWTRDTRGDDGYFIRQRIQERPVASPDRVVLVVDGTEGMSAMYASIDAALSKLPPGLELAVLLAKEGCEELVPVQRATPDLYKRGTLAKTKSVGGQDDVPALMRGWELAAQAKAGVVVWIHGPQPLLMPSSGQLTQLVERSANLPLLYDVQVLPGPNRVIEKLDGRKSVESVMLMGNLRDDLERLFGGWSARTGATELVRERLAPAPSGNPEGKAASLHLARLWAVDEVWRLCAARHRTEATQLAARYQLVTPVSGAVVLETRAQYARAGLEPVPPESVPAVPEPSTGLLSLLALGLLSSWLRRRRKNARSQAT